MDRMSDEAILSQEAISQFWLAPWQNTLITPKSSLKDWISENNFTTPNKPKSEGKFILGFETNRSPLGGLAYDCNRFSLSAIETFYGLKNKNQNPVIRNSTAWLGIMSYYAAFYAAHSILRFCGRSCTQLESRQTDKINDVMSLFHPKAPRIESGYYLIIFDIHSRTMFFEREACNRRPHHKMWYEFNVLLDEIIKNLSAGTDRYRSVMLKLQSLKAILSSKNHKEGTWLSNFRDEINYKHLHGTWYPYDGIRTKDIENIARLMSKPPKSSMEIKIEGPHSNEVLKFFQASLYLVLLCCESNKYLKSSCKIKTFPEFGPLKLLNLLSA